MKGRSGQLRPRLQPHRIRPHHLHHNHPNSLINHHHLLGHHIHDNKRHHSRNNIFTNNNHTRINLIHLDSNRLQNTFSNRSRNSDGFSLPTRSHLILDLSQIGQKPDQNMIFCTNSINNTKTILNNDGHHHPIRLNLILDLIIHLWNRPKSGFETGSSNNKSRHIHNHQQCTSSSLLVKNNQLKMRLSLHKRLATTM